MKVSKIYRLPKYNNRKKAIDALSKYSISKTNKKARILIHFCFEKLSRSDIVYGWKISKLNPGNFYFDINANLHSFKFARQERSVKIVG